MERNAFDTHQYKQNASNDAAACSAGNFQRCQSCHCRCSRHKSGVWTRRSWRQDKAVLGVATQPQTPTLASAVMSWIHATPEYRHQHEHHHEHQRPTMLTLACPLRSVPATTGPVLLNALHHSTVSDPKVWHHWQSNN